MWTGRWLEVNSTMSATPSITLSSVCIHCSQNPRAPRCIFLGDRTEQWVNDFERGDVHSPFCLLYKKHTTSTILIVSTEDPDLCRIPRLFFGGCTDNGALTLSRGSSQVIFSHQATKFGGVVKQCVHCMLHLAIVNFALLRCSKQ
jgi:hypothetical protein